MICDKEIIDYHQCEGGHLSHLNFVILSFLLFSLSLAMQFSDRTYKSSCYYLVVAVFVLALLLYVKNFVTIEAFEDVPQKTWGLLAGFGIIAFGLLIALLSRIQTN